MRIAIITNVIPVYRKSFYEKLLQHDEFDIEIYCEKEIRGKNLNLCHDELNGEINLINSWALDDERLVWQWLPRKLLFNQFDAYIFYGNPRVISNVFWSVLFLLIKNKPIALWGQAHGANSTALTESIRFRWWKLFGNLFVYSDKEVVYLKSKGFKSRNIVGMNNGLEQNKINNVMAQWTDENLKQWQIEHGVNDKTILLSCARLEKKNDFSFLVKALPELIKMHRNIIWCVVGEGDQKNQLESLSIEIGVQSHIIWLGSIYDEKKLAPWFLSSIFMVHPGAIGLSLLHAFGYGLPVVTHNIETLHMPEIAAFKNGYNGFFYEKNNIADLVNVILNNLNNAEGMKYNALETVNKHYNIDVMVERFKLLISNMVAS